jgi:ParB family transcriptional regulator, chromosome partitioning protein
MPMLETRPLDSLQLEPTQVERHRGTEAHSRLTSSIARHGMLQHPGIRPDGTVQWGNGRLLAAIELGWNVATVVVLDTAMTEDEYLVLSLVENLVRTDLTAFQQWQGCEKLRALKPDAPLKELADQLSMIPSALTRLLSPSKTIPEVQAALQAGAIGISDCYELSKFPADRQAEMLAKKRNGSSRDEIAAVRRRQCAAGKPADRAGRIRIDLVSGVTITFSRSSGLTLDAAIDAAGEAARELKRGRDQGLTAKTISKVSAERAKAGG